MEYCITTIRAIDLINRITLKGKSDNEYVSSELDFSNPRERRRYIKSTETYRDTAMFYQIKHMIDKSGIEWNENSLKQSIIFVDFEEVFRTFGDKNKDSTERGNEKKLRYLFDNGISIRFSNEHTVTFIPFEKSNSMARHSKMSFIDRALVEELNIRLNLGIPFKNIKVSLSRYYAYKGLYLSTADRVVVDKNTRLFNSTTVIIIDDDSISVENADIITASEDKENRGKWIRCINTNQKFQIKTVFDGEGIISNKYSEIINEACHYNGATSYQIRMPFAKGMLHRVDFHKFIKEYIGNVESFIITDVFGEKRDLLKAEIVMPVSMFKLKSLLGKDSIKNDYASFMDYYFEQFEKYDHALYISNTNLTYGNSSITKLNYQILNTLDLTKDEFDSLMNEQIEWVKNPIDYMRLKENEVGNDDDFEYYEIDEDENDSKSEDDSIEEDISISYTGEKWKFALETNPVFSHEKKIKSILTSISNGIKQDCAKGKIIVKGELRILSRDLLSFLINLIKSANNKANSGVIETLKKQCLYTDRFFMPGSKIDLEINRLYPIFRNPHLSRNEQCLLKPYTKGRKKLRNDIYYRYFSHLTGIVMVSYRSLVPQALGGADFDGDIVKIIDDKRVCEAVRRGNYVLNERVCPIIDIPSSGKVRKEEITDSVSFDVIKNTFSNRIGHISNLSIRLGSRQYGKKEEMEHTCEECTILTGLEIDAAKTGEHPDLSEILEYGKREDNRFDYIADFKVKLDKINKKGIKITKSQLKEDGNIYKIVKNSHSQEVLLEYDFDDTYRNLDRIPLYYFKLINTDVELPGLEQKKSGKYIFFDFLINEEWKKKIPEDLQKKLGAVMSSYYQLEHISSKLFKRKQEITNTNYDGYIHSILQMQYDAEEYNEKISDSLNFIWASVDAALDSIDKVKMAIERLKDNEWPFVLQNQKKLLLNEILGFSLSDDFSDILVNFDCMGYNILFYLLEDIRAAKMSEMNDCKLLAQDNDESDDFTKTDMVDEKYYREFYNELYKDFVRWHEEKDCRWKKKAMSVCNKKITELLQGVSDDECIYVLYSLRKNNGPDKKSQFFWNHVRLESLIKHIYKE